MHACHFNHAAAPLCRPFPADLSLLKPSVQQQVAASAPVLLVADPGSKPETGLVLSVAPLMGALPRVDARHPRWLHVQVGRVGAWLANVLVLAWQAQVLAAVL